MKLSWWKSILAIAVLCMVIAMIMVAGFLWRPVWPGSKAEADDTASEPLDIAPVMTEEQRTQSSDCFYNQVRINNLATSYEATEKEDLPLGVIDADHPLVTSGYLEQPLTCPVTGEYYVLYQSQGNNAPHTCCPTKIKDHLLPE
ncbi:MAG: hypothetical protein KKB90_07720 [Actinobacteria bacterium]|nr:hypothetical protein [Actinomycetota bacterium]MCG2819856.1 hypothetical protein [Actinomycetes bacterium]MBU4218837.1 hypothetical protein [Actinomycetota bacterium]MBU4359281.1 hypothetical protein [Actinomycetota bacterium]MBU4391867.1 hypothetical protein [Actinomycetota bacterium]